MASISIGGWELPVVPEGWEFIPQYGLRRSGEGVFPSSASFTEEPLPSGKHLTGYVEDQLLGLHRMAPQANASGPQESQFPECDEAQQLVLRFNLEGRSVIQGQIYVRRGDMVGVLTYTTVEEEIANVRDAFDSIRDSSRFRPKSPPPPAAAGKEDDH